MAVERIRVVERRGAGHDEQRGALSDGSSNGQDESGSQSRPGGREDNSADGVPLRSTQGQAGLPQAAGDDPKGYLGRSGDDGSHGYGERHSHTESVGSE